MPFNPVHWQLAHGRSMVLGPRGVLMAIINVTPDSFSDGGQNLATDAAVAAALAAIEAGAEIIDIGGESTKPGAAEVTAEVEQSRVLPVIRALAAQSDILISIDTYRASTARLAIDAGAHVINDVHGLQREPAIAEVAQQSRAGLCIMHTGRGRQKLDDPIADQFGFLTQSLAIATTAGVAHDQIIVDPGFGFAKESTDENVELIARFEDLHRMGYPLLAGTSRKRFLGALTGREPADRDVATAATTAVLRLAGAAIFRVHNVAINRDALRVADAIVIAKGMTGEKQ